MKCVLNCQVFAEHSLQHEVKLEVGGYDVIATYVEMGLGISIVMCHCLTGKEELHTIPLGRYFPKRSYGLVLPKGRILSPAARLFIETSFPQIDIGRLPSIRRGSSADNQARD